MALARPVPVDYWLNEKVNEAYSLDDKLVYIYLITNEHTEQLGIYKITFKTISNEINMPISRVEQAMYNLEYIHNIIRYSKKTNEVAILDYLTYGLLKGGEVIRKCFDNLQKKSQDINLLAYLYLYSKEYSDEKPIFKEVLTKIKEALPYSNDELENMDTFQQPRITYYYDESGYKNILDGICYNKYEDILERGSCTTIVRVKCYDDKYRFVKVYNNGEKNIHCKNENLEFILFINVEEYEKNLNDEEIPF